MVLAAPTYDGTVMPAMEDFLSHLAIKTYRKRTVGLIENGTWAPQAAKVMRAKLEQMKDITIVEPVVSIRSAVKAEDAEALQQLSDALQA
jgi:flavorubredoxin